MIGIDPIMYKANLTVSPVFHLPCWLDDKTPFDSQVWSAGTLCCSGLGLCPGLRETRLCWKVTTALCQEQSTLMAQIAVKNSPD